MKTSWTKVEPIADAAAAVFHDRLFEIDPTTKPLFTPERMPEQHQKLVQALAAVVGALDDLGAVLPAVEDPGRRHAGYGVTDAQYGSVGAALLWTLEQGLGPAWTEAYGLVSETMRAAARGAEVAQAPA